MSVDFLATPSYSPVVLDLLLACGGSPCLGPGDAQGTIVRQRAAAIPQQSRPATGVLVQKLDNTDGIKDVALVPEMESEDEAPAPSLSSAAKAASLATA